MEQTKLFNCERKGKYCKTKAKYKLNDGAVICEACFEEEKEYSEVEFMY